MATIRKKQRKDGAISYQAVIRLYKSGALVHAETRTFTRERLAIDWAQRREAELEQPGALDIVQRGDTSIDAMIGWYISEYREIDGEVKWGRSKDADLKRLRKYAIAQVDIHDLTEQMILDHIKRREIEGAGPATRLNDIVWLGVLMRAVRAEKRLKIDPQVVSRAREAAFAKRAVARSRKRDRLPTADELRTLDEHFSRGDGRIKIPMRKIMWFAIYSARRESEITRIERADDHPHKRIGLLRDAKHPREKKGNHRAFRYTEAAWHIAEAMPAGPLAFPYNERSVSAAFTRACHLLGIENLHFHDLRHEATTRLFEAGLQIHEVAQYTLHENWQTLKRYANLTNVDRSEVIDAPFLPKSVLA